MVSLQCPQQVDCGGTDSAVTFFGADKLLIANSKQNRRMCAQVRRVIIPIVLDPMQPSWFKRDH